jgi:DHA3 family macrolide efflux protein-like MFS transporter
MSRKTVMMMADPFIASVSALLAILFSIGIPSVRIVYVILFLRAAGSVFHAPAMQAAMPMLVPESELTKTGGWSQFIQSGSLMMGPVLGTMLMTAFSIPVVMLVDVAGAVIASAGGRVRVCRDKKVLEQALPCATSGHTITQ